MGVVRGDFEKVLSVQQGPRAAQLSTDVPDVGAPLRLIAPAMKAWGDVFGKLASIGTDYTRRKNNAEREMKESISSYEDSKAARMMVEKRGEDFAARRKSGNWTPEDNKAYEAWVSELALAQESEKRLEARMNLAKQRWSRTGFFGWRGTPTPANGGTGQRGDGAIW